MEVNLENPGGLRREVRVRIPAERINLAVDQRLRKIGAQARLPGFRPGKAPRKVIEQQYGGSARAEAVSEIVQQTFPDALKEADVKPAGRPDIEITSEIIGGPLEYVAKFEVFPEIQVKGLDGIKLDAPQVDVTEEDIDKLLENLRKNKSQLDPVERESKEGDVVTIDFVGRVDGETFVGGEGKDVDVEIGAGKMLPDLENGLIGRSAGNKFTVPVKFPEDYRAEDLQGKEAEFSVELSAVKQATLPELEDAEFLKDHGVETLEELRKRAREGLEQQRDNTISSNRRNQMFEQLIEANPIEVPESMVEAELPAMRQQAAQRMGLTNATEDKLAEILPADLFTEGAKRKVTLGLLLGEVITERKIQLDHDRVSKAIDQMATQYDDPEGVKAMYAARQDLMQGIRSMVLEDQVVDHLIEGAEKVEKQMTLEELLNPAAKP